MAGENLLVVDDSPTILKVVEFALTRAGYRVDTALDIKSGMALARSRRPAVILVDSLIAGGPSLNLTTTAGAPGGDPGSTDDLAPTGGFQLCGALAADAELSSTPIVLMTAKGEDLEARYAQTPNVIDYITKPFSPDAVLAVVTHVIEKTGTQPSTRPEVAHGPTATPSAVAEALSRSMGPVRANALNRLKDLLAERLEQYRQESGAWDIQAITRGALVDDTLAALLSDAGF